MLGGIGQPERETQTCARKSNRAPPRARRLSRVPCGICHPGAPLTSGFGINERRCRLRGVAFVISSPASTSRADERNVGEVIERGATSIAAPLRGSRRTSPSRRNETDARTASKKSRLYCGAAIAISLADVTTREDRARGGPKVCAKCQFGIVAKVIFPAEVTTYAEKYQQQQTNWAGRHVGRAASANFPRNFAGENANEPETLKPKRRFGAAACDTCPVGLRHSGGSQICVGDMIGRPCRLGGPALVLAPPESTSRAAQTPRMAEKSDERARWLAQPCYLFGGIDHLGGELTTRDSRTKCRSGRAASVMCPEALFILARRKPVASKYLSDVAASAESPSLPPRRRRPLGRTSVTSAQNKANRYVEWAAVALVPCGCRRAGGTKPTPAHQAREVASTAVSP